MKKVAIERALSNVKQYLESNNINVEVLDDATKGSQRALDKFDAIVVTGADDNLMGIQDIVTNTQIISAQGKTAEEVYSEIINRTNK